MLMCKNNNVSHHVLKYTILIPSSFPANTNAIAWNVLISFFIKRKRSWSQYNVGLAWNLNEFRKLSYAHRALADKAYPDAGLLLTPVRADQMPLLNHSDRKRARRFKTLLSEMRGKIELDFKEMKTYKVTGRFGGTHADSYLFAWS